MTHTRALPALLIFLVFSNALGCAAVRELFRDPDNAVAPMIAPDRLYEALVDHYVELCAVSQYRPLDGEMGGSPGHAVMYLKGACRDETAPYPRLRPCRYSTFERNDPEHGVGVSVNRYFKNVNWVATPGKLLFFEGGLSQYEMLDQQRFDAAVEEAIDEGMFRGVEFHPVGKEEAPRELRDFIATQSLGTDFGLRFGRTVFCTRLPMPEQMLMKTKDYLNSLNDEYYHGEAEYNWSGYSDNCVHTLHNALAAAGVWKPKSIRSTKIKQFFNLAVPANAFVDLAYLSNQFPIEKYEKVRGNKLYWEDLRQHAWLPAGPGSLVKMLPVLQNNALYDTKYRMFVLAGLFSNDAAKRAQFLLTDGRYLQIDANLRYFHKRYENILADRAKKERAASASESDADRMDRGLYYAYIERQRDLVVAAMKRLGELDALRSETMKDAREQWKARAPKREF